jgi:peptidoglycan/LPS O-acetylase OafA/YrhL
MRRIELIDATRGVLALWVAFVHCAKMWVPLDSWAYVSLERLSQLAVAVFFVMSAYVLSLGYDGHYVAFLARRAVRLYPVFWVCVIPGLYLFGATAPSWHQWLLTPDILMKRDLIGQIDAPAWSLSIELAATPLLPLLFWLCRRFVLRWTLLAGSAGAVFLFTLHWRPWLPQPLPWGTWAFLFVLGAFLAATVPVLPNRSAPRPLALLGRVSYSLYLSHWPVLVALLLFIPSGRLAGVLMLVLALPVAALIYRYVERPSILASRWVGAAVGASKAERWRGTEPDAPRALAGQWVQFSDRPKRKLSE